MIQLRLRTPPHTLRRSLASRPIRGGHRWVEGPKIKVGRTGGRCSCHVPPGDEPAAQGRRPREPICRGRGAGVGKRARRGRGRARPGGAPRGGHARGGGGGSRERDGEAWGVTPAARARSARSAQLGDDEDDHAARSASRGQEPTPSPLSTRVEDRDEPAAQTRPGWRIETGQRGEAGADAPHASSRARRVERRLVGASDGAFGRRNAKEACQRDGLVPRNCRLHGSRTSRGGPSGQIWARPSPRAVAARNRGLERGWSAGWGRRLQRRRGRARGCKCAPRASQARAAKSCGSLFLAAIFISAFRWVLSHLRVQSAVWDAD